MHVNKFFVCFLGSDTDAFTRDPKALYDEYNNFKVHTKKLLEQLFLKLEENNAYTKSLENDIGGLHKGQSTAILVIKRSLLTLFPNRYNCKRFKASQANKVRRILH